jgi:magnesium transporter
MDTNVLDSILENVRAALLREDISGAVVIIQSMRPADQAELFAELEDNDQVAILSELEPPVAADILEDLEDSDAAELASALPDAVIIPIMNEMEPDEAADLLGDIHPEQVQSMLTGMEEQNQELVRDLLSYPDDTAGGLMTTVFLTLRANMTAQQAIQQIHDWDEEPEDTFNIFTVDQDNKLCGIINPYELISADLTERLETFMDRDVFFVNVETDQEECARIMSHYDLVSLPVINPAGVMVGIITVDDIIDILEDEATEDFQKQGASLPLSEPYLNSRIIAIFRKRIGWLLVLFLTEMLTGSVMRIYETELQTVVALSFFIPLMIGTGGNSGSQTTSTIIRSLAIGEIKFKDTFRLLWHEMRAGLLLGVVMGIVGLIRALTWRSPMPLALTVGLSLLAIVFWANIVGAALPPLAAKLKIDPAVISGPVMSTLVDATGLIIYFNIAHWLLHL